MQTYNKMKIALINPKSSFQTSYLWSTFHFMNSEHWSELLVAQSEIFRCLNSQISTAKTSSGINYIQHYSRVWSKISKLTTSHCCNTLLEVLYLQLLRSCSRLHYLPLHAVSKASILSLNAGPYFYLKGWNMLRKLTPKLSLVTLGYLLLRETSKYTT